MKVQISFFLPSQVRRHSAEGKSKTRAQEWNLQNRNPRTQRKEGSKGNHWHHSPQSNSDCSWHHVRSSGTLSSKGAVCFLAPQENPAVSTAPHSRQWELPFIITYTRWKSRLNWKMKQVRCKNVVLRLEVKSRQCCFSGTEMRRGLRPWDTAGFLIKYFVKLFLGYIKHNFLGYIKLLPLYKKKTHPKFTKFSPSSG